MAYVFFASYSSIDNQPVAEGEDGLLWRLIKDLSNRVRARMPLVAPEQISFFAQSSITTGTQWRNALETVLCNAKVIVCLCSPAFFRSEWCAREFNVFRQRLTLGGEALKQAQIVIPVIWEPMSGAGKPPAALEPYQFKDNRLPADYPSLGLYTLSRLKSKADDCYITVNTLADVIVAAARGPALPMLPELPKFEDIARSFHNPGAAAAAYDVVVGFLHDDGPNWVPAGRDVTAADIVDAVCATLKVNWRELVIPVDLKQSLDDHARGRQAVILLTDAGNAEQPRWKALLDQADAAPPEQAAVLVGCSVPANATMPAAKPEDTLSALLPTRAANSSLDRAFALTTPEAFKKEFERAVVGMRLRLIKSDPPKQTVTGAELEQSLKDDGLSAVRPIVTGPGGPA